MFLHTKKPTVVPNDVIIWHENKMKFNIRISACKTLYCHNSFEINYVFALFV